MIIEDYVGQKIDDIQRYDVDIFAIGSDWVGKFDYLNEYCKVIYLPRTEGVSSTQLRAETQSIVRIGIVGSGRIARRFVPEAGVVDGAEVNAVYNPDKPGRMILKEDTSSPRTTNIYASSMVRLLFNGVHFFTVEVPGPGRC